MAWAKSKTQEKLTIGQIEDLSEYKIKELLSSLEFVRNYSECIDADQGTYTGFTKNSNPHGPGQFITEKGSISCGQFVDGSKHGYVETIDEDGNVTAHQFKNGKPMKVVVKGSHRQLD